MGMDFHICTGQRRLAVFILLGASALTGPGVIAEEVEEKDDGKLEEVVVRGTVTRYSAMKSDTPIVETTRSVSIENRLDLIDKGALNLADAYLYSSGVIGEQYGFATRGDWVAVRGLDVPEYRDSLQALFGSYNNTRPDIYTIEQVEILKGPASVLYGQGSPGGIVNVVSKTPLEETYRELDVEYGNFDHVQVAADLTGPLDRDGKWLYRLIGVYRDADSQVDYVGEEAIVFAPSLTWRPNEDTNLTALLNYQDSNADVGSQFHQIAGTLTAAPNGRFLSQDLYTGEPDFNHYDTESLSVTLLADHQISEVWSIEATARYTDGDSDYSQAWVSFFGGDRWVYNADGSLYQGGSVPRSFYSATGSSEQYAVDARVRVNFSTGALEHEVLGGIQYQHVTTETDTAYAYALGYDFVTGGPDAVFGDQFWLNVFDPVYGNMPSEDIMDLFFVDSPESTTEDLGFYINDQVSYENWRITLGIRYDEVDTDTTTGVQEDDALSFSIGALYQFENGLSPYVNYAESFQPVAGTDTLTGAALKPREGEQVEVGIKYQPDWIDGLITAAWFHIEESNLGNPNTLVGATSQQEGESTVEGFEIEAFIPLGDFRLEANFSSIDTEDPNGFHFASVPEEQASAWLGYRPRGAWQGFKAGAGIRYASSSWDGADNLKTPSYTLGDLMLGYETDKWDLSVNVHNISDREYIATCLARGDCFLGEARTVVGRIRYKF